MKLNIKRLVGKTELVFEVECENHMAFFKDTSFISDLPSVCGKCGSSELKMSYSKPQGYEYGEVKCLAPECQYRLTFGIRKEDHYMYAKEWEAPYLGDAAQAGEASTPPTGFGRPATPAVEPEEAPAEEAPAPAPRAPSGFGKPTTPAVPRNVTPPVASRPATAPLVRPTNAVPPPTRPVAPTDAPLKAPSIQDRMSKMKADYGQPSGQPTALSSLKRS